MTQNTRLTLFSAVALAIVGTFPSIPTLAQESAALEEVIVTARKREENLQEIPIAITAVSAADILEGNVTGLEDIAALAPGFYFFKGEANPGAITLSCDSEASIKPSSLPALKPARCSWMACTC